jgi:hypothetical protein
VKFPIISTKVFESESRWKEAPEKIPGWVNLWRGVVSMPFVVRFCQKASGESWISVSLARKDGDGSVYVSWFEFHDIRSLQNITVGRRFDIRLGNARCSS